MTPEELARYVERQKEITSQAKKGMDKVLKSLKVGLILGDRAKARERFISAVLKYSDKYFNQALENGRSLKKVKIG